PLGERQPQATLGEVLVHIPVSVGVTDVQTELGVTALQVDVSQLINVQVEKNRHMTVLVALEEVVLHNIEGPVSRHPLLNLDAIGLLPRLDSELVLSQDVQD